MTDFQYRTKVAGNWIPETKHELHSDGSKVSTPEWMIQMDDILKSSVDGLEDHCELFGFGCESGRATTGTSGNELFTSAAIKHSDVSIIIPNGSYGPVLENKMNTGATLVLIKIIRLAHLTDMKKSLQEIEFGNCKIQNIRQELDRLIVTFRIETRKNTNFEYDQAGESKGQNVTNIDYTKNTVE